MKIRFIAMCLLTLVSAASNADIYEQIGVCKKLEDSAKKLECFAALPEKSEEKSGTWTKEIDKSPIDDSKTVFINSEELTANSGKKVALALRCKEAKPEVLVATDMFFGLMRDNGIPTIARFDEEKAEEQNWGSNPEGSILFAKSSKNFIKAMLSHKKLTLRLQEFNGSKHDISIDLAGLSEQMTEFKEVCKLD